MALRRGVPIESGSVPSAVVRPSAGLSQDTLFDFLTSTGLPLVSRLVALVRWSALALAIGGLGYGLGCLLFVEGGFWTHDLPWAGALPALATAPLFLVAYRFAERGRMQQAGLALFAGLFVLSLLATWPRGAFSPSWYLQPVLALLATCCLGVVPGLTLTLVAVVVVLLAPFAVATESIGDTFATDLWTHTTSLAALTLASALTGVLVHKVLIAALETAEVQRRKNVHSRRALRYREKLLRHAMRIETVGDLAGLVSHQLRNAYQVMMGHVSLGSGAPAEEAIERLNLIGEALERTRPLLDQLMVLAHPDEGKTERVDLAAEVRRFHALARRVMPATMSVEIDAIEGPLPVVLNPRGLEHALWNLVINARQAMPAGGSIRLGIERQGETVEVFVRDTGCGIPPGVLDRIFDPYFTTKPPGEGTGLGLVAVDRFVRSCNGAISVQSELGRGTTFCLTFPLAADEVGIRSA